MKQIKFFILSLIAIVAGISCSPTVRVIGTWVNKEKLAQPDRQKVTSVFINVMTQNEVAKSALENDLADAAAAKGIKSVKSYYVFGPVRTKENLPPKDLILKNIRNLGCNAIFTVVLMDKKSETRYNPGTALYNPYPYYGYYGTFSTYYAYSSVVYTPGYYTTNDTYYLESNLYDANTEELLVSMQSKVVNPSSIEKGSKQYTKALMQELENQGLLKK